MTFDVAVDAFDRVDVRPVVCFDGDDVVMRCAPYAIPLVDLLVPSPMSPSVFDALWNILPASAETSARRRDRAQIATPSRASSPRWAARRIRGRGRVTEASPRGRVCVVRTTHSVRALRRVPDGRVEGACERFAADAWNGEPVLCVVSAAGRGGVRLEHRAWSAATLAPLAENPRNG